MKISYFIAAHTKTLIGLALALIHTPFLSILEIWRAFYSDSTFRFGAGILQMRNSLMGLLASIQYKCQCTVCSLEL